ncbi:hypothetical protein [Leptolyngbya sp. FACHB-16]|nr:hypothetical protein [Leptolyngbya sp. FACHB-16]
MEWVGLPGVVVGGATTLPDFHSGDRHPDGSHCDRGQVQLV